MSEQSRIPYEASDLGGKRILVLAAHPDDEVAGPGGTVALSAPAAESVRIWIATDGTGQEGVAPGGEAEYGRRRRQESLGAARVLGLPEPEFGGLPDRDLLRRSEELRLAVESLFDAVRPDLVFCPSPVEIHPDHRALAEALYGRVAASRAEDADHDLYRFVRIAFYEISHPLLPNALVDIAAAAEKKERAAAEFASQQIVRDYAGAVAGLNAYRRLTLSGRGPVEAFRVVTYEEASTRSLEEFCRSIGPARVEPGGRGVAPVAAIVRTRNRPALLREAVESLAGQTQRPACVVVVNDGGAAVEGILAPLREAFPILLEELPSRRGRSAAGNRGLARAEQELVGFLDDDDRCYADHFERLVRAHRAGPEAVVYADAATVLYRREGEAWRESQRTLQYSLDFDPDYLLLANYIPIHSLLAPAALISKAGGFDEKLEYSEDWDLLIRLSAETSFRHVRAVTCEYRVFEEREGDPAHVGAGAAAFQKARQEIYERYRSRRTEQGLARVIDRLRAQISVWYHRDGETREKLARLPELEARNAALEGERLRHLARTADLLQANEEYRVHVSALHREVERLNGLLERIYASRTWRLHLWLDRLRGR
ncbi:MAG TPA: PIG-L family deacetylase [Thermoanaerobaculia bacterium]|nr:PIG-L family deacetylase [Thermoanaerobaculia bacterium]